MNPLGLFLNPQLGLLTHLHTVYLAYAECLPTRLNPLAEGTCFSQAARLLDELGFAWEGSNSQDDVSWELQMARLKRGAANSGGPGGPTGTLGTPFRTPGTLSGLTKTH